MSRIFITGSSDGIGFLAAMQLIKAGHEVILHARNKQRAKQTLEKVSNQKILIADLSSLTETKTLAKEVNESGNFDVVIHNAGVYENTGRSPDGLPVLFGVNTLAPYLLTCMISKPKRLIYISSEMHRQGAAKLNHIASGFKDSSHQITYSDTKLHDLILMKAVSRKWKNVYVNAVHPGWVPTKMGGSGAPDSLEKGYQTQVWLAESNDAKAKVSGKYFHHKKEIQPIALVNDEEIQEKFLESCARITGVRFR